MRILLSPDGESTAAALREQPAKRAAKAKGAKARSPKESPAEEVLHELFRTQGMDLRESPRTIGLVRELVKLLGKEAK